MPFLEGSLRVAFSREAKRNTHFWPSCPDCFVLTPCFVNLVFWGIPGFGQIASCSLDLAMRSGTSA